MVETGAMIETKVALALLKAYADASDSELAEMKVTHDELLRLAREYLPKPGYGDTELVTISRQVVRAYVLARDQPK